MHECMQSLDACAVAAAMCAGSDMMHGPEMATCCAMCSKMVEMAQATMHMMMRPTGMNMDVMSAMMTACTTMGKACAAECRAHADMDQMCRYCAMACDDGDRRATGVDHETVPPCRGVRGCPAALDRVDCRRDRAKLGVTVLGYDDQLVEIEAVAAVVDR